MDAVFATADCNAGWHIATPEEGINGRLTNKAVSTRRVGFRYYFAPLGGRNLQKALNQGRRSETPPSRRSCRKTTELTTYCVSGAKQRASNSECQLRMPVRTPNSRLYLPPLGGRMLMDRTKNLRNSIGIEIVLPADSEKSDGNDTQNDDADIHHTCCTKKTYIQP